MSMRRWRVGALVCASMLSLAAGSVSSPAWSQGRMEARDKARQTFEEGLDLEARAAAVKHKDPERAQELYEDALEKFEETLSEDSRFVDAYARMGYVAYAMGRGEDVAERLDEASKLWPDHAPLLSARGAVLFGIEGQREASVALLERATVLNPEDANAFLLLGKHYYDAGDVEGAESSLQRFVSLRPDDVAVYGTLGSLYLKNKRYEEAAGAFQRFLAQDPQNLTVNLSLAQALYRSQQYAEAADVYQTILTEDPDHLRARFNLASTFFQREDFQRAIKEWRGFLQLRPKHATTHYMLGLSWEELRDEEKARGLYSRAVELRPELARGHWRLGQLAVRRGELDEASQHLEEATKQDPNNPRFLASSGDVFRARGDLESAVRLHRRAADLLPNDARIRATIAFDFLALGDLEQAREEMASAYQLAPEDGEVKRRFALVLLHHAQASLWAGDRERVAEDLALLEILQVRRVEKLLLETAVAMEDGDLAKAKTTLSQAHSFARDQRCTERACLPMLVDRARARLLLEEGNPQEAFELLNPWLLDGSNSHPGAANDMGRALAGLGRWKEALDWFVQAKDLGMDEYRISRNLALASIHTAGDLAAEGKWKDAQKLLRVAEESRDKLQPHEHIELDLAISAVLADGGAFRKASETFKRAVKAIKKLPKSQRALLPSKEELALDLRRAYLQHRQGQHEKALKALSRFPKNHARIKEIKALCMAIYVYLGNKQIQARRYAQARSFFGKALALDRNADVARHNLAVIDYLEGKIPSAAKTLEALASRGRISEALFNYGIYLDDHLADKRGAHGFYLRVKRQGGPLAQEAARLAAIKERVFGFQGGNP